MQPITISLLVGKTEGNILTITSVDKEYFEDQYNSLNCEDWDNESIVLEYTERAHKYHYIFTEGFSGIKAYINGECVYHVGRDYENVIFMAEEF